MRLNRKKRLRDTIKKKKTISNTWKEVRVKILLQHTDQMMFANNIAKSYPSGLFSIETVREGPHPCGLWKS